MVQSTDDRAVDLSPSIPPLAGDEVAPYADLSPCPGSFIIAGMIVDATEDERRRVRVDRT